MDSTAIDRLTSWFQQTQRQLPWRENPSPYSVWVSEIMLQQTRVSVVIPYFLRWMERFPTIQSLANAPVDDVLKEWEGLGYYSRARNLHAGAKYVVENFSGELPSSTEELLKIKGLGRYTVGAIRSFAFKKKAAAVDGNVLRVLTRYYSIHDDISKLTTQKNIHKKAEELLPEESPWITSEALIELGATLCNKTPLCQKCPLMSSCLGYQQGVASQLPVKAKREKTTYLYRGVIVLECCGYLLLSKGQQGRVMADLYEFPFFELEDSHFTSKVCERLIEHNWGFSVGVGTELTAVQHTFTRYKATLVPLYFTIKNMEEVDGFKWFSFNEIEKLPFSSGHKRILAQLAS